MSERERVRREVAAVIEADVLAAGAKTDTEITKAVYASLRSLTGLDENTSELPSFEIVRRDDRFRVRLMWSD